VQSSHFYTHFSLLRSLEAGFNLPCLNHACDADVAPLADLFRATHAPWPQPAPR
jgi:phosphatidylinositol-3-phosphatase